MNRTLTRWERVQLGVHTTLCSACRRYRKQIRLIQQLIRAHGTLPNVRPAHYSSDAVLSPKAKERLRAALRA